MAEAKPTRAHRQRALEIHFGRYVEHAPAWLRTWVETGDIGPGSADGKPQRIAQGLAEERQNAIGDVAMALLSDRETSHQRDEWAPVLKSVATR